jgi:AcrR family transcriptional regulator
MTISILEERGEAGVRVHDIAHANGVSTTSLYRYFGSRDNLIVEARVAQSRAMSEFADAALAAQMDTATSAEEFRAVVVRALTYFMNDPERIIGRRRRVFMLASTAGRDDLLEALTSHLFESPWSRSRVSLERIKSAGWVRPDLDIDAATNFMGIVVDGRVRMELNSTPEDIAGVNRATTEALWTVLFKEVYPG